MRNTLPIFLSALAFACALGCVPCVLRAQPRPVHEELALTALPLLPYGGEYLIGATWAGTITSAEVRLAFTTAGDFQAQHFVFEFAGPTGGVFVRGGADLNWSGQGTFAAEFVSEGLNGEIVTPQGAPALNYWFMNIAPAAESLPVPLEGELGTSHIRLTIQPCLADWDGSYATDVRDIFAFLADWFADEPNADIDGFGGVGVGDIFRFLSLWFAGCSAF
ncbi:MAG: hypothetical protein KF869_09665 [Phycisphaeraceae bacterium]|nr:hypothetical protein [Phycisphaeraceae bacterium]